MATRISSATFVGRRAELDVATAALDRARGGSPGVLFVAGEAGVGKTRFVEEITGRARQQGVRVLSGGCVQLGGEGLPFGPLIEALRGLAAEFSPLELDELLGAGKADLLRLMPSIQQSHERQPDGEADRSGQGRLFEHLLLFLQRLARLAATAVVVEDIHWADRSTLELVGFLVHNLREGRIALLATYRSDELHRRHPLLPLLASVERRGTAQRVELLRFNRPEVAAQLEGITGAKPDADLVDAIYARSDGNAFFAEELLAAETSPGQLPETLAAVLAERIATLSDRAQELIRVAAAAGSDIRLPLLAAVSQYDDHTLSASLREALDAQILVRQGDDRFGFRHALVQEAVYDDLLPSERSVFHAAFARIIDEQQLVVDEGTRAAELAYHWQAAQDLPRALDAWIRAGLAAEAIYALSDARAHFERALGLWDRVPDARARAPFDRIELLVHAADAAEGPSPLRSLSHIRAAIALVDDTVDPTRAGLLHERLGEYAINVHDLDYRLALDAYREAVRLVPAEPPSAARARVLAGLGKCLTWLQWRPEASQVCEEALRVARSAGDLKAEATALIFLGFNLVNAGNLQDGLGAVDRACKLSADSGDRSGVGLAMAGLAACYVNCAQYGDAALTAVEAAERAVRDGLAARFGVGLLRHAAEALLMLGQWDEAAALLERAQQYYPSHQEVDIESCLLMLEALRGDLSSANRRAGRMEPLRIENIAGRAFIGLAELALWQGDPATVRELMRTAVAIRGGEPQPRVVEMGEICSLGLRAEADLAERARQTGSEPELQDARTNAASLLARMRALAEEISDGRPVYGDQAQTWLASCEAEWQRVEGASDPDLWATAAARWDAFHVPYRRAYALMREGQAALRRRDRTRARAALATAHAIAVGLGAAPLRQMIEELAARVGGAAARGAQADGRGSDLSRRELEVLRLIGQGQSDGEIAEILFISKKTASVHVAHIKSKLGARSRVEIATYAVAPESPRRTASRS